MNINNDEKIYKTPIYTRKAIKTYQDKLKEQSIEDFKKKASNAVIKSQLNNKQQHTEYTKNYYINNKNAILEKQRIYRNNKKQNLLIV